jgi:hypothetical protein
VRWGDADFGPCAAGRSRRSAAEGRAAHALRWMHDTCIVIALASDPDRLTTGLFRELKAWSVWTGWGND